MPGKKPKRIWLAGSGKVYCCNGRPNTCNNLTLLKAKESPFHNNVLREATDDINQIFRRLRRRRPEGTHLALIDTSLGLLLVWAEAIDRPDDISEFVRAQSSEEDIREALRLEDEPAAEGAAPPGA